MACNHKDTGHCNFCSKSRKPKGKCDICGVTRYATTCRTHMSNGMKIPRTRGKHTTKSVKNRRKQAFIKKALVTQQ